MARCRLRSELRFLISQRVPKGSPAWRTETLASIRMEPSSMRPSEAPVAIRIPRNSLDVGAGLGGAADVGPRDDLDERHARAVVVDERPLGAVDASAAAEVGRLAGVLFEVRALDA